VSRFLNGFHRILIGQPCLSFIDLDQLAPRGAIEGIGRLRLTASGLALADAETAVTPDMPILAAPEGRPAVTTPRWSAPGRCGGRMLAGEGRREDC
jgi:hypothetical protein